MAPPRIIPALSGKYKCEVCDKWYGKLISLQKHQKYDCQKEATYKCPMCPFKAKRKYNVKLHYNGVHLKIRRPKRKKPFLKVFVEEVQ